MAMHMAESAQQMSSHGWMQIYQHYLVGLLSMLDFITTDNTPWHATGAEPA